MNHKLRFLFLTALTAACLVFLTLSVWFLLKALHYDTPAAAASDFKRPSYHFVLVPEEMDNPYWRLIEKGAKDAAKKYNAAVEYSGPVQRDMAEHVNVIEAAIASRVDGIITQGINRPVITPIINQAIQKGIPVVTVDTDAPGSRRLAYVGTDNYEAGRLAGEALVRVTGGKAKVAIITGSLEPGNQTDRVAGFKDAVKSYPGIQIVDVEPSNITKIQAAEKTYDVLIKHPDIDAFVGTSALDGMGITAVIQSYKKKGDIHVIAFDTLPETLELIQKGWIDATIAQDPYQMGYKSVETMVDILNGKRIHKIIHTPCRIVTAKDLQSTPMDENGRRMP